MIRQCLWCLCVACVFAGQAAAEPMQVYLLAGQSNMVGAGSVWDLPTEPFNYLNPQPVAYSYDLNEGASVSQGFEALRHSVFQQVFGPELSFGRAMDEAVDAPIGIIKVAANGTALSYNWNPVTPPPTRALYLRFLDHVNASLATLGAEGVDYQIAGMLWMQGESDTHQESAAAYKDNLTSFIQHVRADLNAPQLPFYIGRLNRSVNLPNVSVMRQAQADVARADPYTLAVDLDAFALRYDLIHYSSFGQIDIGQAFANAVLYGAPNEDFDGDGLVGDNDLNAVVGNWHNAVPAASPGDVDGDGVVGLADLKRVVDRIVPRPPPLGVSDLTGDEFVGIEDLTIILQNWNLSVPQADLTFGDLNGDGFIGIDDLTRVLTQWNTSPTDPALYTPTFGDLDLDGDGGIGPGDIELLLLQWSFVTEMDPDLPLGLAENPLTVDFNADGVVDVEDLRFLTDLLPIDISEPILQGDLNGDGFVGLDDLSIVLAHFNQSVPSGGTLFGDATGDGFVGIADLDIVLGNWNAGVPPAQSTSVPEPATGLLLLVLLFRRRLPSPRLG